MAKTIRLVKVQATTNNITRGIITYLNVRGHYAFRVNSTGLWDPTKKVIRRPNGARGIADIICCLHYQAPIATSEGHKMTDIGLFCAIEVKNKYTKDRIRKSQEAFSVEVTKAGGLYIITQDYGSFIEWYEDQKHLNQEVKL